MPRDADGGDGDGEESGEQLQRGGLHCVATRCTVLQQTTVLHPAGVCCNALYRVASRWSLLQRVVPCCIPLESVATRCTVLHPACATALGGAVAAQSNSTARCGAGARRAAKHLRARVGKPAEERLDQSGRPRLRRQP
jgi:hypothetical protein